MFKKICATFFCIVIYINCFSSMEAASVSGLTFHAHRVIKEKRTSLLLNDGKSFNLPNGFRLEFDIKFQTEEHNYGYIYRIIGNDTTCFDLISNHRENNKVLSFIEGNRVFLPFKSINHVDSEKWNKIIFNLDLKQQKIAVKFNDEEIETLYPSENLSDFRFQFGFCNFENFTSYDVPPIRIKDIRLFDSKNKLIAFWPLDKHNINEVYDSISSYTAKAYNPIWEIDRHTKWEQEKHFKAPLYTQVAYNEKGGIIYLANNDNLFAYNLKENSIDTIRPNSGYPYHVSSNQLIYNPYTKKLVSYDPEYIRASMFDFDNNTWSDKEPTLRTPYTHHNNFISPIDSSVYMFGGYGEYLYNNDILKLDTKKNQRITIDYNKSIAPRYLSAVGFKDVNTLLLLGGYGNESGKQELGPHNYYDLYEIDIRTFDVKKKWNITPPNEHYVFSSNMIVDSIRNKIYVLTFPNDRSNTYLQLRSFSLDDGTSEILGDSIPYIFEDINSFCSLFLDSNKEKLYALSIHNDQSNADVAVHSLLYPPLSKQDIKQKSQKSSSFAKELFIIALIISFIGFAIYYRLKKQRKTEIVDPIIVVTENRINTEDYSSKYPIKKSSVLFLNGFQVWDKTGADITKEFTPTLKYLLILIILYTQKNEKGVSNTTLREILWNDKSDDSAQNNRRVNIQKLKKLLNKLDGVEVTNTNTYWSLKNEDSFFSDYTFVFQLITQIENKETLEYDKLYELLHLLSSGIPLPYLQQYWADPFISDYSLTVQKFLWSLVQKEEVSNNNNLCINIADIIFLFDPIEENALDLKCSALFRMDKVGVAKTTYDSFCVEYERMIGIPFNKEFSTMLHKNN